MKKFIVITILSIMFIITGENDCEQYKTSKEACRSAHADGLICDYVTYNEGLDGEEKLYLTAIKLLKKMIANMIKISITALLNQEKKSQKKSLSNV